MDDIGKLNVNTPLTILARHFVCYSIEIFNSNIRFESLFILGPFVSAQDAPTSEYVGLDQGAIGEKINSFYR